jgi:membrane-associated protease RseP (regulator of RpoE activity)
VEVAIAVPTLLVIWMVLAALLVAWEFIAGAPASPPNPLEPVVRSPDLAEKVFYLVLVVTAGPVAEEVLFRGLVYNALRQRIPAVLAAVLQALAFGFLHPYGVIHAVLASVLGLALVAAYEWRGTLLAPILLHALQNAAAVIVAILTAVSAANAPVLGVNGEPVEGGCRVTAVAPASGAEAAGLRAGDILTAVDGYSVADVKEVAAVVRRRRAGDTVVVEFVRDGERLETEAVLRKRE